MIPDKDLSEILKGKMVNITEQLEKIKLERDVEAPKLKSLEPLDLSHFLGMFEVYKAAVKMRTGLLAIDMLRSLTPEVILS